MNNKHDPVIVRLRDLHTIRSQANRILELARTQRLAHFSLDESRLPSAAQFVADVILENYPDLNIPYHSRWRHFEVGGDDRIQRLRKQLEGLSSCEKGKIFYELVIVSVLLDAGAGSHWVFYEKNRQQSFNRSEGLAIASLEFYLSGALSRYPEQPCRVDAEPLRSISLSGLKKAFQVTEFNPMDGLAGRLRLLNQMGKVLETVPKVFGSEARLGNFYPYIETHIKNDQINIGAIFQAVLQSFADVWPQRLHYKGVSLGDVWIHPQLQSEVEGAEYVPFHKLSQWLSYSLIEPLEWANVTVNEISLLTGLPEYRNGGLLIDMGVIKPKFPDIVAKPQRPDSLAVVEWRALTVALLDQLACQIREILNVDEKTLPLAKILQGGTWDAGRRIARHRREAGTPPIAIMSDGTVM